ncbi:Alpha/Beta hydrolase protein [Rhexocercosporidium sp. MPI-PUGE-AT-0058]|nr:Alpha/Beta hydrolase protein [Rhexocercosporidium sp. MPI-PUGE-AT-0058]
MTAGKYLNPSSVQALQSTPHIQERLTRLLRSLYSLVAIPIHLPLIALDTLLNTRYYGRPSWTFFFRTLRFIGAHMIWAMNPGTRPSPDVLSGAARQAIPKLKSPWKAELVVVPAKEGVWYGDALNEHVQPRQCPCFWMWKGDEMVNPSEDAKPVGERKVMMYFVGGGMVQGHPLESPLPWLMIDVTKMPIFGVNFRKAITPETAFPAALQDAVSAFYFLVDCGFKAGNISMMGDSGGGGIVTTTILYLRAYRDRLLQPGSCILISPFIDLVDDFHGDEDVLNLDLLNPTMCSIAATQYTINRPDLRSTLLSPGRGSLTAPYGLSGLPDMLICYGDAEIFMPSIQRFFKAVLEEGNRVECHRGVDQVHVYPYYTKDRKPSGFYGRVNAFLEGEVRVGECED